MKPHFFELKNVIQNYAWGSVSALETLFDMPNPSQEPQAELWMGAHPNGCSEIQLDGESVRLSDFILQDPEGILGQATNTQFGELPYLFKILNAGNALSVQVHPNKQQAEEGFELENQAGIALDAPTRNYRDANHKPELVYALTPYLAMNGFRPLNEMIALFKAVNLGELDSDIAAFIEAQNAKGLSAFFSAILAKSGDEKDQLVNSLIEFAQQHADDFIWSTVLRLSEQYPGDIGVFAPLMLNVIELQAGEAMYLDAGIPHAYIHGTGLEIMANSDNVLRAGLTGKHMDLPELVKCTHFTALEADKIRMLPVQKGCEASYPIPVADFQFSVIENAEQNEFEINSAEILLPIDAELTLIHTSGETMTIQKGQSVFIPAYTKSYQVTCQGKFARAFS